MKNRCFRSALNRKQNETEGMDCVVPYRLEMQAKAAVAGYRNLYGEMMQKYADFADKIDKYDSNSMSTEDSKYYIEVTTRCAQKMLEAY